MIRITKDMEMTTPAMRPALLSGFVEVALEVVPLGSIPIEVMSVVPEGSVVNRTEVVKREEEDLVRGTREDSVAFDPSVGELSRLVEVLAKMGSPPRNAVGGLIRMDSEVTVLGKVVRVEIIIPGSGGFGAGPGP